MGGKTATKSAYFDKLKDLLEEYKSVFIVTVDNVSSQQMHKIRKSLRGDGEVSGVVLMGKNTMVASRPRRIRQHALTVSTGSPGVEGIHCGLSGV